MKPASEVPLWFLLLWTHASAIIGSSRSRTGRRKPASGKCEIYNKELCKSYLGGRPVFVNNGETLTAINNQMETWLDTAQRSGSISTSCWPHAKALLCYHIFPACDKNSRPVRTLFCRDECRHLEQRLCRKEFLLARSISVVRQYIPYCGELPGHGSREYEKCQRLPTLNMTSSKLSLLSDGQKNGASKLGKRGSMRCMFTVGGTADFDVQDIRFMWSKDGQRIKKKKEKYKIKNRRKGLFSVATTLVVKRVQMADFGKYNCSALFGKLRVDSHATFSLQKVPGKTRIEEKEGNVINGKVNGKSPNRGIPNTAKKRIPARRSFGKCSYYGGVTCRRLLNYYNANIIFEYNHSPQYLVEAKLQADLAALQGNKDISKRCHDFGLAVICFNIFQACNPNLGEPVPRLCKSDCRQFEEVICKKEVRAARIHQSLSELLPDCDSLPERNPYCISLFEPRPHAASTTPSAIPSYTDNKTQMADVFCYHKHGQNYRGKAHISKSGKVCKNWKLYFPDSSIDHNFCRNFGGKMMAPWCFVGDGDKEICKIPKCSLVAQKSVSQDKSSLIIYIVPTSVVLALCLCATAIVVLYLKCRKRKYKRNVTEEKSESIALNGKVTLGDPIIRPIEPGPLDQDVMKVQENQLAYLEKIREGSFREVWKAEMKTGNETALIIVKKARTDTPQPLLHEIQREMDILRGLCHPNVLELACASAPGEQQFVGFKCDKGVSLKNYILSKIQPKKLDTKTPTIEHLTLIDIAGQICAGMEYLHYNNFIHKDLGTRNCLVSEGCIVKVACYGFGPSSHPEDYYCNRAGEAAFALRWMSPEALVKHGYTVHDDTWAFGVLLWELFSFGKRPYTETSDEEVIHMIERGDLLPCPEQCPARIYGFMKDCWEVNPKDRPQFSEMRIVLRKWLGEVA